MLFVFGVFFQLQTKATSHVVLATGAKQNNNFSVNLSDWLYYRSNKDFSAYLGYKKEPSNPLVLYQQGNDYLKFSLDQSIINNQKTDTSTTSSPSLETKEKDPNNPILFYRDILPDTDITYQIDKLQNKVKEEIILKANPKSQIPNHKQIQNSNDQNSPPAAPERSYGGRSSENLTFLFSAETSAKPVKQKDGSIAFFDNNGSYLFNIEKPFMIDANLNRSEAVTIEIVETISEKTTPLIPLIKGRLGGVSLFGKSEGVISSLFKNLFPSLFNLQPSSLPTTHNLQPKHYQIILTADSNWLSTATYPVIIDPTVTHNADSNFTGQMNRIADADSTSSTQLESSYPEQTKDPYTVMLLHFNEANGTTVGITDMASSTRVITANGNASTTSATTQLGMGNSAALDGTGDYLSAPDSEDWNFGSGDFSIDFWFKRASSGLGVANTVIATQYGDPGNRTFFICSTQIIQ